MKTNFLFLLLPFLSLNFLKAQSISIQGTLVTADQKPAEYISVGVKTTSLVTQTNSQGEFTLSLLQAGTYTLCAGMNGCSALEESVTLQDNEPIYSQVFKVHQKARELEEITVSTVANLNDKPVSVGKLAIKSMDLPQSLSIIERDVLEKQQTQSMADVLRNFNGVYLMGTTGGVQQEIAARGFALNSSNTFKNGVRYNNGVSPEMSSLEKVEILKGSAAILYGNVSAGGIINLVTKKPNFQKGGEVSMRFDSYKFYKPSIDLYGVLDQAEKIGFRINTSYENAGSFRDQVKSERMYFNPSVAFKLSKKTDLVVEADYLKDRRTADFGVGAINYQLIDVPRSTFIGAAWSNYVTEQKSATATLTHRFNRKWQVRSTSSIQDFANDLFGTMRPNSNSQFVRPNGNWVRGIQRTQIDEQYLITQLDLSGTFNTGVIKHTLLIGADADRYTTATTAYNPLSKYDSVNVFNLDLYKQRNDQPDLTQRTRTEAPILRAGAYIQDLIDFGKLKVLAGARYSYLETGSRIHTYSTGIFTISSQSDVAVTPRFGLVYQPTKKLSFFGSYANSFTPNTGVDMEGKQLAPSYINQIEAGAKSNVFKDRLSINVTVYQIVNSNLAQTNLSNGNINTNIKELAGEVTSKGAELDIQTKSFHGFTILAGYSYNETRYTKSNTFVVGSLLRYNPNHTANGTLFYHFEKGALRGWQLGTSVVYIGERMAGRSTRVTVENDPYQLIALPAYTTLDLNAGYQGKNYTVRFKVSNLTNALSYNVHDDNSVNPIAPRQFATTLSYRF